MKRDDVNKYKLLILDNIGWLTVAFVVFFIILALA